MDEEGPLEEKLARIGRARAHAPEDRKQDIKARLFGDPVAPRRIGRFTDLGLLGEGAMGTVRRAYDEQLAREVAIKLVNDERSSPRHHERLQREAQALAQLSHPNVVQIYEVVETQSEIFIAMELIDGVPLNEWQQQPHPWRQCLEVYLQAGRGLAAAHTAGLIHRDFKPSNCIRDSQGRVRVLDFGLARALDLLESSEDRPQLSAASLATTAPVREASDGSGGLSNTMLRMKLTADKAIVGTIAYMAPEQFVGKGADARSDQFSFCVALHQAIYGQLPFGNDPREALAQMGKGGIDRAPALPVGSRPVPRALQRALRRGLAAKQEARWPTMDALLEELQRTLRPSAWRRSSMMVVVAGGAAVTTATFVDQDPCRDGAASLDDVWNEDQRLRIHDALMATGASYAGDTWATVEREVDAYAGAWKDASVTACRSPASSLEQRCLRQRRAALEYRIGLLSDVDEASSIVAKLPSIEACASIDERMPPEVTPTSAQDEQRVEEIATALDHARALDAAARFDEGLSVAAEAIAASEALGNEQLHAQALLVEGHLRMNDDDLEGAEATLRAASTMALQHGTDDVVVESNALLSHLVGILQSRSEHGLTHVTLAVDLAERPSMPPSARAMAHTSHGNLSTARGEHDRAQHHYERALEILEREYGEDHLSLVEPLDGLATALRSQGDLARALEQRERAMAIQRRWQGDQHPATALTQAKLASILYDQRDYAGARRNIEQALPVLQDTLGPDHSQLAEVHQNLAAALSALGEHAEAAAVAREAIRIWTRLLGSSHPYVAKGRLNLAAMLQEQGELEPAAAELTTALHDLDPLGDGELATDTVRLIARIHRELGRIRYDQDDLPRAEASYREGIARLERSGLEGDPMMSSLLNHLGHVVLDGGDGRGAETLHLRALGLLEGSPKAEPLKIAHTHRNLARALFVQRRWDEAQEHAERARGGYEAEARPEDQQETQQLLDEIAAHR